MAVVYTQAEMYDEIEVEEVETRRCVPQDGHALEADLGGASCFGACECTHEWPASTDRRLRTRLAVDESAARIVTAPPGVSFKLAPIMESRYQHTQGRLGRFGHGGSFCQLWAAFSSSGTCAVRCQQRRSARCRRAKTKPPHSETRRKNTPWTPTVCAAIKSEKNTGPGGGLGLWATTIEI